MSQHKSVFTSILPYLCIIGIIVLVFMWDREENPFNKKQIQIEGPQTSPFAK